MGIAEATTVASITAVAVAAFAWAGGRKIKRARLIEHTPTTPAARPRGGDEIEIQGRVVAGQRTSISAARRYSRSSGRSQ